LGRAAVKHLQDIAGRYPRLTPADEIMLGRAVQEWQRWPGGPQQAPRAVQRAGQQSLDRFVLCNQRLAIDVAKRHAGRGVELEDLIMAAIEGMIRAYKRFDPSLGYRSSSYAIWYAAQGCQKLIHRQGLPIRLPGTAYTHLRKILKASDELSQQGITPSRAQIAAAAGLELTEVENALAAFHSARAVRIDAEGGDADSRGTVSEERLGSADDGERLRSELLHESLSRTILYDHRLCPQQSRILRLLYLNEPAATIATIAQALNCSTTHIRALEHQGLSVLRSDFDRPIRTNARSAACSVATPMAS
jgi:RNA polymerase nonessential primary-like sigma factor